MIKAKLVREIPQREGCPWYFRKYELECIECGEHYLTGRYDSRTSPYCVKCQKVHDREKAKERAKRKKQAEINEVLDKIRAEIKQEYKVESEHPYGQGLRRVLEIIDKYKAESEG